MSIQDDLSLAFRECVAPELRAIHERMDSLERTLEIGHQRVVAKLDSLSNNFDTQFDNLGKHVDELKIAIDGLNAQRGTY